MAFVKAVEDSEIRAGMRIHGFFDVEGKDLLTKLGARLACAVRCTTGILENCPRYLMCATFFPLTSSRTLR